MKWILSIPFFIAAILSGIAMEAYAPILLLLGIGVYKAFSR